MKINYSNSIQLLIFSCLLVCFGLCSCQNSTNKEQTTTTENQEMRIADEKQQLEVSFMLSNVEDDINGTQSTITATLNGKNVEITKATNCIILEKEEYDSKDIPLDATWACGCWWAGAGENFYAQKMDTKVEIYKKEVYEEMKTEDEKWVLFKTLE